jgi:hypothetical protein
VASGQWPEKDKLTIGHGTSIVAHFLKKSLTENEKRKTENDL